MICEPRFPQPPISPKSEVRSPKSYLFCTCWKPKRPFTHKWPSVTE